MMEVIEKIVQNGNENDIQFEGNIADDVSKTPTKRKAEFPELFKVSTGKKRKLSPGTTQIKNAVVTLNEYKAGLHYEVLQQSGPVHQPTFVVGVTVNGQQYKGEAGSKKAAKQVAAENALKSIVQFKNPSEVQATIGEAQNSHQEVDYTADPEIKSHVENNIIEVSPSVEVNDEKKDNLSTTIPITPDVGKVKLNEGQNPIMALNELKPGLQYDCYETGKSPATKKFNMKVTVDEEVFIGTGDSKKGAKAAVARAVLNKLYNMSFSSLFTDKTLRTVLGSGTSLGEFSMDQTVADNVGKLVLDHFNQVMTDNIQYGRRKVIAGIVMSRDDEMKDLEVISVSTGTKCVNGEYMSVSGTSLNDCHAEIISRRCLLHFLYRQLEQFTGSQVDDRNILVQSPNGGYCLKPGIRFHLYINTAPCGDARIFSPHEVEKGTVSTDNHSNRKSRGQLRTKIESGEGTIPVKNSEGVQTWDGVLQGARLLTMSCSDKVCRWNVLGVQGALLSYWLEPIYMHSVVLGSLFHPTHMYRALGGRIKSTIGNNLPPMFRLHTPRLNLLSSPDVRQPGKAPNHSVNWVEGETQVEVMDAMKGKDQNEGTASRLCKHSIFDRWLKLAKSAKISWRIKPDPKMIREDSNPQYIEVKEGSKDFQLAKNELFKAFKAAELGTWVGKPMEQDEFQL